MTPKSPVIPGSEEVELLFGEDQPEYQNLPGVRYDHFGCGDGVMTRWKLGFFERIQILFTGNLYLHQLTFGKPLQPQLPSISPLVGIEDLSTSVRMKRVKD